MSIEQVSDSANLFYLVAGGGENGCWLGQAAQTQLAAGVWQHFVMYVRGYIDTLPERRGFRGGKRSKRYTLCTCYT